MFMLRLMTLTLIQDHGVVVIFLYKKKKGRSFSFLHLHTLQRVHKQPLSLKSVHLCNCTHHISTRTAPLVARRCSNFLNMHGSVSTLLPPLTLPLISSSCILLLDHFTLVPASISCHSHPVDAGREGTVHSPIRAFWPELTATSHQECSNHRYILVGSQSFLFDLE